MAPKSRHCLSLPEKVALVSEFSSGRGPAESFTACEVNSFVAVSLLNRACRRYKIDPAKDVLHPNSYYVGIEAFSRDQNDNFRNGHAYEVCVLGEVHYDYAALNQMKPENWKCFRMMMPKIANKFIPKSLVDLLTTFLARYPNDMVELTFALSMTVVWCRLMNSADHELEKIFDKRNPRRKFRPPRLAVFLLYANHFIRFHEEQKLSAYGHIFRFVHTAYSRDMVSDARFHIFNGAIDQEEVLKLVSMIGLQDEDWVEVVPASWEGTKLTMPRSQGEKVLRSDQLTAKLLLPDVCTMGLPGYINEGLELGGKVFRQVSRAGQSTAKPGAIPVDTISVSLVNNFMKTIVAQFHAAREGGQISSKVKFGNDGLTWKDMPKISTHGRLNDVRIDIEKLATDYVAMLEDCMSEKDRAVLKRIVERDFGRGQAVAVRLRSAIRRINVNDADLSKSAVTRILESPVLGVSEQWASMASYRDGQRKGDNPVTEQVLKSCCVMLGIELDESPEAMIDAITKIDGEVGRAVSTVEFLHSRSNDDAHSHELTQCAVKLVLDSKKLEYWRRLGLFYNRIRGIEFDAQDEATWTNVFGEPYHD
ncbi:hypothetical protein Cob_v003485 [Colletotrichum orbiculare MAFF 240422]|uniref:Uncharacterized protein n=1 Tax=Colletotrichum orbiculare (strain 104-T / ATCC 96160 / CBS 514.97 / LARS 414 / MAFF 240422) TaxID=1213857 RepID=A0A484G250_COLOR|nr:hypothetical protein Cob_v003485 [Colletotrichum orbiculare MAFF 240422]